MTEKFCALSVRRIKPGSYDDFRSAWDPREHGGEFPPFIDRMMHLRSVSDPDLVISFGLGAGATDEIRAYFDQPEMRDLDARRQAAIQQHVDETLVDEVFGVAEEIVPTRAGR